MIRKLLERPLLVLILVSSAVLRIILVWNGGARFFPDEGRYGLAFKGLLALGNGHLRQGLGFLMLGDAHQFFPLVSLIPALIHTAAIVLIGWPLLDYRLAASVFSFASVAVISLIYALARQAGADETEALFATLLGACANTLFYFSRHLTPYDASLALCLFAFMLALKRDVPIGRSVLTGFVASSGVLVYNGFYTLAALVGVVCVVAGWPNVRSMVRKCVGFACGACVPGAILLVVGLASGVNTAESVRTFSETINQGSFSEGWEVPFSYLWQTEHRTVVLWALACAAAVALLYRREPGARRAGLWLAAVGALYAMLAIASTGLHRFVVYGRLVRPMVPFLCLTTAFVLRALQRKGRFGRIGVAVVLMGAVAAAYLNFAAPLRMVFPQNAFVTARRQYGIVREQSTCDTADHFRGWFTNQPNPVVSESMLRKIPGPFRDVAVADLHRLQLELAQARSNARAGDIASRYVLFNAEFPYFWHPLPCHPTPEGAVLGRWQHPLKYPPYQYEGMTPEVRAWFRSLDYSMVLVALPMPAPE